MTTIVGRLARSLSQGPDALGHRHSSSATDEDNLSPRRMGLQRLSGSPSFNDFSLSVQEDAEEEYRPLVVGKMATKPEDIIGVHRPEAMRYQPAVPSSPPPSSTLLPGAMLASPRAVKSKHIKIMDMDPYDYCELLRGSSL